MGQEGQEEQLGQVRDKGRWGQERQEGQGTGWTIKCRKIYEEYILAMVRVANNMEAIPLDVKKAVFSFEISFSLMIKC